MQAPFFKDKHMGFIDELYKGLVKTIATGRAILAFDGVYPPNIALGGDKDKGFPGGRITEISAWSQQGDPAATMAMIGFSALCGLPFPRLRALFQHLPGDSAWSFGGPGPMDLQAAQHGRGGIQDC
jgi:hypothetical protein